MRIFLCLFVLLCAFPAKADNAQKLATIKTLLQQTHDDLSDSKTLSADKLSDIEPAAGTPAQQQQTQPKPAPKKYAPKCLMVGNVPC